jgi:hypothetical protein
MRARCAISSACARAQSSVCSTSARGVRELGRLVARLLGQAVASHLGLAQLRRRVAVRLSQDLAGLLARRAQDLGPLTFRLLPDPGDLGLVLLELHLLLADLLLGTADLLDGRILRIALDRVGELRRRAHDVKGVHADSVTRRLRAGALRGGLEHSEIGLQGREVPPEGVEGLLHLGAVVTVRRARKVLEPRQGREARLGPTRFLRRHVRYASPPRSDRGLDRSMPFLIGWFPWLP